MKLVTKFATAFALAVSTVVSSAAFAKTIEYKFDVEGAHTFVQFRAKHLGVSWLYGRFNKFDGSFSFDAKNDANNKVSATVDITSLDSNHAERDVHLKGEDFFNLDKFKSAKFESVSYKTVSETKAELVGKLTILGVTKEVKFDVDVFGRVDDPWTKGLERRGFEAKATVNVADFGMKATWVGDVDVIVSVEGIGEK